MARKHGWRHHCLLPALLLGCASAWEAKAADFGDLTVHSWLGRQLKASVLLAGDDARESEARCYKALLLNLNNEVVGSLKATLQHSAKGSVLLLFGGNAVDEPAAMVRIENTCGTGGAREYALLLDQVPDAQKAAAPTGGDLPQSEPWDVRDVGNAKTAVTHTTVRRREEPESAITQAASLPLDMISAATGMRMAARLAALDAGGVTRLPSMPVAVSDMDVGHRPALKLAHSLGTPGTAVAGKPGDASRQHTSMMISVLTLLAVLCVTGWITMRVRTMNASSKPWMPADMA